MINTSTLKRKVAMGLLGIAFIFSPLVVVTAEEGSDDCSSCGVVISVQEVATGATGMGAAAGAVAGGLAGNQVDSSTTSTLVGAAIGLVGGHIAEQAVSSSGWTVTLNMNHGGTRTLNMSDKPTVKPGDHVQIRGSNLMVLPADTEHGEEDHGAKHEE